MKEFSIIISFLLVIGMATFARADRKDFTYDDHGKRDPFWPLVSPAGTFISYESDLTISDMILEGISSDATGSYIAIINGTVVRTNDKIGLFKVAQITSDQVILVQDKEKFILNLTKGGGE